MIQRETKQLPKEIVRPVRIKEILLIILGSLLVVLCVNFAAIRYLPEYGTNWGDRLVADKWHLLLDMKEPVDWLILGDSSGAVGVVPSVINERLGGTSINLCTHAGVRIVDDAWMLDTYIERLGPPKHVLLVHTIGGWTGGTGPVLYNLLQIPLGWGFWSGLQPPVELTPRQSLDAFLVKYVPLYSHNTTLGSMLKTPWIALTQADDFFQDDGLLLLPEANPWVVSTQAEEIAALYKETKVSFNELAVNALERIAALSETYDFDVWLATGPIYEGLYENPDYLAYANQVRDWLDTFVANHERLRYVLRAPMTFPADLMENVVHVSASAAPLYTEALVSEIMLYYHVVK